VGLRTDNPSQGSSAQPSRDARSAARK
jgi:hypothetical protein